MAESIYGLTDTQKIQIKKLIEEFINNLEFDEKFFLNYLKTNCKDQTEHLLRFYFGFLYEHDGTIALLTAHTSEEEHFIYCEAVDKLSDKLPARIATPTFEKAVREYFVEEYNKHEKEVTDKFKSFFVSKLPVKNIRTEISGSAEAGTNSQGVTLNFVCVKVFFSTFSKEDFD